MLGGGPAGLGAAYRLACRQEFEVSLLERNPQVGGNAGSFEISGIPVDFGSHRLHPSCHASVLADIRSLLGDDLLERPRHGRILLRGRWLGFPLKPLDLALKLPPGFILGVGADALKRLSGKRRSAGMESFESVIRRGLGNTIAEEFYLPYAQKIWGLDPGRLSATQARRRVAAGSLTALVKKAVGGLLPSARPKGRFFYYPRSGFGQISSAYAAAAEEAGAAILRGTSVTRIRQNRGVWHVEYEQDQTVGAIEADHVWSTIPLSSLARCMEPAPPAEVLESAAAISFRAMILIYLTLSRPRFTEFDAHYFPGPEVIVSRISEPKNYRGTPEPRERTVLCAELPCSPEDRYWQMSDEELGRETTLALEAAGLPVGNSVCGVLTRRLRYAYPIYESGYEEHFVRLENWLGRQENLISFGRQGLFAHDNTHHALFMAYAAGECLDARGQFDQRKWHEYLETFKSHVVED
ncbi:MAG: FAD-dependent oxidoreductase [Acidobacteriota bacterium]